MAMTFLSAQATGATIKHHNDARGTEIESIDHGLVMLLADLIEYADYHSLDIDLALEDARRIVREDQ
jgi:hypothetical protein